MKILSRVVLVAVLFTTSRAVAQEEAISLIQKSAKEYASGYLNPFGNILSAVFNSGQYHTADVGSFHIYASLQATGAIIPEVEKTFSPSFALVTDSGNTALPPELRGKTLQIHKHNVPTILGGQTQEFLIDTILNGTHYQFGPLPPGIDQSFVPLVVPHVEIGTFMGTELILRGIPAVATNSSIGKIGFYGIGLRHSFTSEIPLLPVDISAQLMYQHLNVGDLATIEALNLAVLGSIDLPIVTLYGGIQLERARLHVHYDFKDPAIPQPNVDLSIQSTNNVRATLGATVKVLILYINGQVTFAPVSTLGLGVGVRIPPSLL